MSTQALVNETCDEKRFRKSINKTLEVRLRPHPTAEPAADTSQNIRNGVHDGLFTAREGEENWGIAHRVLMPAFGPLSIQGMFPVSHLHLPPVGAAFCRRESESISRENY